MLKKGCRLATSEAHNSWLQLLPFSSPPLTVKIPIRPSLAERANKVSIDPTTVKNIDKDLRQAHPGPLVPVQSHPSPIFSKVSRRRKTEQHNYSSYWLILYFFFPYKQRDPMRDKRQREEEERKRQREGEQGGWTQKESWISRETRGEHRG